MGWRSHVDHRLCCGDEERKADDDAKKRCSIFGHNSARFWRMFSKLETCSYVSITFMSPLIARRTHKICGLISAIPTKPILRHASTNPNAKASVEISAPSYYWDTAPPKPAQLQRSEQFFRAAPPKLMFSATSFRTIEILKMPEVAFLGRSNVGKSSLLNALMGKNICHTSSKPGRTRSMNFFAVGGEDGHGNPGRLAVLDMPGYGKGSREEWGTEIMKYLVGRKQYEGMQVTIRLKFADGL